MCMYGQPLWRLLHLKGLSHAKPQGVCLFLRNLMVRLPLRMSEWCMLSLGGSPYVGSFMEVVVSTLCMFDYYQKMLFCRLNYNGFKYL